MLAAYDVAHGLRYAAFRYFNVAGASERLGEDHDPETHLIPSALLAVRGDRPALDLYGADYPTRDGTAIRDYIHIDDLSAARLLALEGIRAREHRIFNLGNGAGFSVRDVIATARGVTGTEIPVREAGRRPGDPPRLIAASAKIRAELGWAPRKTSLEEMVRDAWEFARSHRGGYSE
jgi:UDP-glucose 4-epimerase